MTQPKLVPVAPGARPFVRAALAVAVAAMVVGCSAHKSASGPEAASTPPSATAAPSASPSAASPSPSLPAAADGADPGACADGTCEIRVTGPVTVPLPESFGLDPLQVLTVDARTVTMVAYLTGSEFASDGGCPSGITGPSADGPGFVNLTCDAGAKTVVNDMVLEVAGVVGKEAVLRVRPAK